MKLNIISKVILTICVALSTQCLMAKGVQPRIESHYSSDMSAMRGMVFGQHNTVIGTFSVSCQDNEDGFIVWNGHTIASGTGVSVHIKGDVPCTTVEQILRQAALAGFNTDMKKVPVSDVNQPEMMKRLLKMVSYDKES